MCGSHLSVEGRVSFLLALPKLAHAAGAQVINQALLDNTRLCRRALLNRLPPRLSPCACLSLSLCASPIFLPGRCVHLA